MTSTPNVLRWNPAGLSRFRYVDANAATWLEELRRRLRERFPGAWSSLPPDAPAGETELQRQERLIAQYEAERGAVPDWGWELARAFARALHVLTEHVDAYANEGYLRTATQWESVRRLLALIDYRPAPPASAMVALALRTKGAGKIGAGLAFRHAGTDGPAIVFETLEGIEVDPALDAIRPAGASAAAATAAATGTGGAQLGTDVELLAPPIGLQAGDAVRIDGGASPIYRRVVSIAGPAVVLSAPVGAVTSGARLVRLLVLDVGVDASGLFASGDWSYLQERTVAVARAAGADAYTVSAAEYTTENGRTALALTPLGGAPAITSSVTLGAPPMTGGGWQIAVPATSAGGGGGPADGGTGEPIVGNEVPLDAVPPLLARGRRVIVEIDGAPDAALLTRVAAVDGTTMVLADALPAGATRRNVVVSGNVVVAGHGERQPDRVLGSGDATRTGQRFVLAQAGVAFVADAAFPMGVRADVEVTVDRRRWVQVPTLRLSRGSDPHYTVEMTEDGFVAVAFGDGQSGRRLPTGENNVRISYRTGAGRAGNLAAGSLTELARAHALVTGAAQPLPASGGEEMEDVQALRTAAPTLQFTLERAVSLEDFGTLATALSSVWQARAFGRAGGRGEADGVDVVVVPAGGGPVDPILREAILRTLRAHAAAGVGIAVSPYLGDPLDLHVTIEVDSTAYDPPNVKRAVESALLDAFSLRRRSLGAPVHLSEVYHVVERVEGVENSECVLDGRPGIQVRAAPSPRHVVHLPDAAPALVVEFREYAP